MESFLIKLPLTHDTTQGDDTIRRGNSRLLNIEWGGLNLTQLLSGKVNF